MNMNVNSTECLVKVSHLGYTAINNICTGAVTNVTWGPFDWVGLVAIGFACGLMALIFVALLFATVFH